MTDNQEIEAAIRKQIEKPKGELTKADLEKVTSLNLDFRWVTDAGIKEVAKLEQLTELHLDVYYVTDAGFKEVAKLQQLTKLHLSGSVDDWVESQITASGL